MVLVSLKDNTHVLLRDLVLDAQKIDPAQTNDAIIYKALKLLADRK